MKWPHDYHLLFVIAQIMFCLAIADFCGLACTGTLFGYTMINGMVYCSDVTLSWVMGVAGTGEVMKIL